MSEQTDSYPLDETGQVEYPTYDNRSNTALYTLEDVQAYEAELARANVEDREPTLTDPRLRTHATEILDEQPTVVEPFVDSGNGGVSLNPGVSNVDQGVVTAGPNAHPVGFSGPQDVTVENVPVEDESLPFDESEPVSDDETVSE
ncbi:MAG TPA: hypothetical protein VFK94_02100 [Patescibacteria group bacterium]|nr:hypothetical protein [Patescibacteria group bacterium]